MLLAARFARIRYIVMVRNLQAITTPQTTSEKNSAPATIHPVVTPNPVRTRKATLSSPIHAKQAPTSTNIILNGRSEAFNKDEISSLVANAKDSLPTRSRGV